MDVWNFLKVVFDRTNENWRLLLVEFITSLVMVPIILLGIIIPVLIIIIPAVQSNIEPEEVIPYFLDPGNLVIVLLGVLIFLIFLFFVLVLWAYISGGVRATLLENIMERKQFKLNLFFKKCKKFFARIVGLWSLMGVIYLVIFIILGGLGSLFVLFCVEFYKTSEAGAVITGIFGGGIFFLAFMIVGFLIGILLAIANTYLIAEDADVVESVKGGVNFIKEYTGHTFLVVVLLIVIGFAVGFVFSIITMPIRMIPYVGAVFSIILSPVQMGLNLYISLFSTAAYFILYLWKKGSIESDFHTSTVPEKTM
jgi:hypothetical protein